MAPAPVGRSAADVPPRSGGLLFKTDEENGRRFVKLADVGDAVAAGADASTPRPKAKPVTSSGS